MKQRLEGREDYAADFKVEGRSQEPMNERNTALESVKGKEMDYLLEPGEGIYTY